MARDVNTVPAEHLPWAVAGAWKPCPCIQGPPCRSSCSCHAPGLSGGCDVCHGYGNSEQRQGGVAGRISALPDTVRVLCDSQTILDDMNRKRHFHYGVGWYDGCPGWTPSTDLAVWEYALFQLFPRILIVKEFDHIRLTNLGGNTVIAVGRGAAVLQHALVQALVADGWTLGQAPEGVI